MFIGDDQLSAGNAAISDYNEFSKQIKLIIWGQVTFLDLARSNTWNTELIFPFWTDRSLLIHTLSVDIFLWEINASNFSYHKLWIISGFFCVETFCLKHDHDPEQVQ